MATAGDHDAPDYTAVLNDKLLLASGKMRNNIAAVKDCLEKGAEVNCKDRQGRTPLHLSARGGCMDTANELISSKADVNAKDSNGYTPLALLCIFDAERRGFDPVPMVKLLLDNNADANTTFDHLKGECCLHVAVGYKDAEKALKVTEQLIGYGGDPCLTDSNGTFCLLAAAQHGNADLIEQLLLYEDASSNRSKIDVNQRAECSPIGITPLETAVENDNVQVVEILVKRGARVMILDRAEELLDLRTIAKSDEVRALLPEPTTAPVVGSTPPAPTAPSGSTSKDVTPPPVAGATAPVVAPPPAATGSLCCICLDAPAQWALVPCGHQCLCSAKDGECRELVKKGKKKECPICKAPFTQIMKVFTT